MQVKGITSIFLCRPKRLITYLSVIILMNTFIVCSSPNTKQVQELRTARDAVFLARMSEAEKYAPTLFQEAVNLMENAEIKFKEKRYEEAVQLAIVAKEKANDAVAETKNRKKEIEQQKIREANEILKNIDSELSVNYEKPMQITWYRLWPPGIGGFSERSSTQRIYFYPYIGRSDSGNKWFHIETKVFTYDRPIYVDMIRFVIDGEVSEIRPKKNGYLNSEFSFSSSDVTEEFYITNPEVEDIIRKMVYASEVYVTAEGSRGRVSIQLTKENLLSF